MSSTGTAPGWASAIAAHSADLRTADRVIDPLAELQFAAVEFCRLLERWLHGDADPSTPNRRAAALRREADRAAAALARLGEPLGQYLVELEAGAAEGRSWFGEPGEAELVDWRPVLRRAGVAASPHRVAVAYLELAVLVRALEGLSDAVRWGAAPDRASLWAGLFDLRENLFDRAQEDLRALAA